jgi:phosphoglycerate dehydrogenase-like enzyme
MVFHAAGSVKGIVTDEFWERGVRVSSAACVLGRAVAETTLGLTIYSMKNIEKLAEHTRNGGWDERNTTVREIYDLKIGVVGAGNAGRHYIKLLRNFQVEILLYDPTLDEKQCREIGAEKADLETLMKLCDVVSIHAPSIPATRHMINADNLKLMKDRAVLINTARGSLIDEAALIKELETGRISACIDVTDPEPPAADSALRKLPNILLTPHLAGNASTGKKRIGGVAVSEIALFTKQNRLEHEIFKNQMNITA